ncbi:MAG: hypothetical protein QXJ17_02570 [Nitrososphaeria archaeon]
MDYQQFKSFVRSSVESSLSLLGENSKKAIIIHFMKNYNLSTFDEVSEYPSEFETFLGALFGYGSNVLVKAIIRDMFDKLDIEVSTLDMDFPTAVRELKKMLLPEASNLL